MSLKLPPGVDPHTTDFEVAFRLGYNVGTAALDAAIENYRAELRRANARAATFLVFAGMLAVALAVVWFR